ncbi:MAG: cyclic nucleotide-binding domain-containing protein [Bacteriovorax sp.]|nr:cyclic nucleotide-binding domain-containing protein [Bacteriovorax sp.]
MSTPQPIKLENEAIAEIKGLSPQKKYSISSPLFYEGQVPIVAYLLLEGCIQLLKNKKIKKILKPGSLIGLNELMTNSPSKLSAQVQAESTLCFLDKSTIQEIILEESSTLAIILREETK